MKMNFMTILLFPTSLLKSMTIATMNENDLSSWFFKASATIDLVLKNEHSIFLLIKV